MTDDSDDSPSFRDRIADMVQSDSDRAGEHDDGGSTGREPPEGYPEGPDDDEEPSRDDLEFEDVATEVTGWDTETIAELQAELGHELGGRGPKEETLDPVIGQFTEHYEASQFQDGEFRELAINATRLQTRASNTNFTANFRDDDIGLGDTRTTQFETQVVQGIAGDEDETYGDIVTGEDFYDVAADGLDPASTDHAYMHRQVAEFTHRDDHFTQDVTDPEVDDLADLVEYRSSAHQLAGSVRETLGNVINAHGRTEDRISHDATENGDDDTVQAGYDQRATNARTDKMTLGADQDRLTAEMQQMVSQTVSTVESVYDEHIKLGDRQQSIVDTASDLVSGDLNVLDEVTRNLELRENRTVNGRDPEEPSAENEVNAGYTANLDQLAGRGARDGALQQYVRELGGPVADALGIEESDGMLDNLVEAASYFSDVKDAVEGTYDGFQDAFTSASSSWDSYTDEFQQIQDMGLVEEDDGTFTYGETVDDLTAVVDELSGLRSSNPGDAVDAAHRLQDDYDFNLGAA